LLKPRSEIRNHRRQIIGIYKSLLIENYNDQDSNPFRKRHNTTTTTSRAAEKTGKNRA